MISSEEPELQVSIEKLAPRHWCVIECKWHSMGKTKLAREILAQFATLREARKWTTSNKRTIAFVIDRLRDKND